MAMIFRKLALAFLTGERGLSTNSTYAVWVERIVRNVATSAPANNHSVGDIRRNNTTGCRCTNIGSIFTKHRFLGTGRSSAIEYKIFPLEDPAAFFVSKLFQILVDSAFQVPDIFHRRNFTSNVGGRLDVSRNK